MSNFPILSRDHVMFSQRMLIKYEISKKIGTKWIFSTFVNKMSQMVAIYLQLMLIILRNSRQESRQELQKSLKILLLVLVG